MVYQTKSFIAYDTLCVIRIENNSIYDAETILNQAEKIAHDVESTLSMYDANSELSRLCNNYVPGGFYKISDDLFEFLSLNLEIAAMTDGRYDPTMGAVVKLWNGLSDQSTIPDSQILLKALSRVGYQHIFLNPDTKEVKFDIPEIRIDPGASGKGFALSKVANFLKKNGVKTAVLDFGGNLYAIGGKPDEISGTLPWKTGIRDPDKTDSVIGTVPLLDAGIATSSWYEHYFEKDGRIYHHILDSKTGFPVEMKFASVSVISSSALFTDILSTVLFLSRPDEIDEVCKKLIDRYNICLDYVAVLKDRSIIFSPHSEFQAL